MSEFTPKNFSGLTEAYASIYNNTNKQEVLNEDTLVDEVQEENFEIDEEALCHLFVDYLVVEGYVKTKEQAVNIIPHMGDQWMLNILEHMYLSENFYLCMDSLVEDGYDLSSYSEEELYEVYIQESAQDLHEVPLLAAPLLANPATWAAGAGLAAGIGYAGKKALDAYRQMRTGTDPASQRWLETGSYEAKPAVKPTSVVRTQTGDINLDQPSSQPGYNPPQSGTSVKLNKSTAKSPAAAPAVSGGGGGGQPPEDPNKNKDKEKSNFRADLRNRIKQQQQQQQQRMNQQQQGQRNANRFFKALQRYNQSPVRQGSDIGTTLGRIKTGATALKNVLIGKTAAGAATRAAGLGAGVVGDEIVSSGATRERLSQGIQTGLLKSRTEGEKERQRIREKGTRERDAYLRSQQQSPAQRPIIRNAQGQVTGLGGG